MLSNLQQTASELRWRTLGTQKGRPLSSKGVMTKYKNKKRDKRVRDGDLSQGGSCERGEISKHKETLSSVDLWGVLESQSGTSVLEPQHYWEDK